MSTTRYPSGRARVAALRLTRRGLLLILLLFGLTAMSVYPLRQYVAQHQRVEQLAAKQRALDAEVRRLEEERARLDDPAYVEQLAREELYMAKPGEEAWVLTGEQPTAQPTSATATPGKPGEERPWYLRFWDKVTRRAG